jgi:hypothetical protein
MGTRRAKARSTTLPPNARWGCLSLLFQSKKFFEIPQVAVNQCWAECFANHFAVLGSALWDFLFITACAH